jgi:hypothetical protein
VFLLRKFKLKFDSLQFVGVLLIFNRELIVGRIQSVTLGYLLNILDHLFQQLLVLLKVRLQVLNVFVFVVYSTLQPPHGKHELLHLET